MEKFHRRAKPSAHREPKVVPLPPLAIELNPGHPAFCSLVIPLSCAHLVAPAPLRHQFSARHLINRSGY
jgi:hypothetical protein